MAVRVNSSIQAGSTTTRPTLNINSCLK